MVKEQILKWVITFLEEYQLQAAAIMNYHEQLQTMRQKYFPDVAGTLKKQFCADDHLEAVKYIRTATKLVNYLIKMYARVILSCQSLPVTKLKINFTGKKKKRFGECGFN